jgi:hypothetical protein
MFEIDGKKRHKPYLILELLLLSGANLMEEADLKAQKSATFSKVLNNWLTAGKKQG